uniref:Uncharacterized protein n=1 Tax=Arion vulgaris TaxID=1028688 RepID=A0A0B7AQ21_9EUPU
MSPIYDSTELGCLLVTPMKSDVYFYDNTEVRCILPLLSLSDASTYLQYYYTILMCPMLALHYFIF